MRANLPQREPRMLAHWEEIDLYRLLMEERRDATPWVLHDGPPYANGRVHMGTALNKILKDFVVRSRAMMGFRTPFVPGWDCHGMPIEHQVTRKLGRRARTMPVLEVRKLCRVAADRWIDIQRAEFKRLGVIGDWGNPYLTFDPAYDAAEVGVLRNLVEQGYVYRGRRPVHWCFDCRTALAEAEVEFQEHESPSIYVAFRLNEKLEDASALAVDPAMGAELVAAHRAGRLFALIWTTTPWTLPANLGICLNRSFEYVALGSQGSFYIVAARLSGEVERQCGLEVDARIALDRAAIARLDGLDVFHHPFIDREVKLMFGDHVTAEAGTGLVHTAPGHGYEDFVVGQAYGLGAFTPVDDAGVFTDEAGEDAGQSVFSANEKIVARLEERGALLHAETLSHSYPHCWRCKQPLIFRATEQWFLRIDHKDLRRRVLEQIDNVRWVPPWSKDRIRNMTENRPDWCLSRQRAWGVPIPALRCEGCGHVALDPGTMKRAEETFAREGSDAWYSRPVEDFLAPKHRCGECGGSAFSKEHDVLDVWFDSGCSQAAVLAQRPELTWPADAYLEAVEQARGWFQSSLICATAERNRAPFRGVISHGLTLDEAGRKMSKSLGNSEDAVEVVKRYGADVLRLVYASVSYSADMNIGPTLFASVSEAYRKLRNTARYLLGNLADFDPAIDLIAPRGMQEFDRFILARVEKLKATVRQSFEAYDFQAAYHAILNFVVVDLSSLYIDVVRDRLYCSAGSSHERRSAQTALYLILDALLRMLAPLIPFTADEIYSYLPGNRAASIHLLELPPPEQDWCDAELEARWERMLQVRSEALKLLETMRQRGAIGAPLEAEISVGWSRSDDDAALARAVGDSLQTLKELFIVSGVSVLSSDEVAELKSKAAGGEDLVLDGAFARISASPALALVGRRARGVKCQRCWVYYDDGSDPELCPRCRSVVRA